MATVANPVCTGSVCVTNYGFRAGGRGGMAVVEVVVVVVADQGWVTIRDSRTLPVGCWLSFVRYTQHILFHCMGFFSEGTH